MAEEPKWYVVHTYSGYENKVASSIEKAVENRRLQDLIFAVSVPTEKVMEISENRQVEVERNDEYSIFEYRLCPSLDFQQKLLSMGDSAGVLAPVLLKDILRKKAEKTANNNA